MTSKHHFQERLGPYLCERCRSCNLMFARSHRIVVNVVVAGSGNLNVIGTSVRVGGI